MEREHFIREATAVGVAPSTAALLHARLWAPEPERGVGLLTDLRPAFAEQPALSRAVQVLSWAGVGLICGAHAWWSYAAYESTGYGVVLALTLAWQLGFLLAAERARERGYTALVAGFATIIAVYTPLAVYALLRVLGVGGAAEGDGFEPWVSQGWLAVELAAIAVAVALLSRYRRPLQLLPLCVFAVALTIDLAARAIGDEHLDLLVVVIGLAVIVGGILLDRGGLRPGAFWPHLVGLAAVGAGLPLCLDDPWVGALLAAAAALTAGVALGRTVYLAAGGLFGWIGIVIAASDAGPLFAFALIVPGVALIGLAVWLATSDSALRRRLLAQRA